MSFGSSFENMMCEVVGVKGGRSFRRLQILGEKWWRFGKGNSGDGQEDLVGGRDISL